MAPVPSILWQFAPNTVEDADIPAANSFMAFTQNVGMTIGALIIGNAITIWGWGMGSWIGMLPLYVICLIIYFAFGGPEEAQASVVSSTRDASSFETAHPFVRSLPFEHRERKLELSRANPWSQASVNAISDAKYEGISQGGPRFPHLCTILNSRT